MNSAKVKNSRAMGNMLVLHAVMWRKRWRRKRRYMWVHPIDIKGLEFVYLATFIQNCSRTKRNFLGFLE